MSDTRQVVSAPHGPRLRRWTLYYLLASGVLLSACATAGRVTPAAAQTGDDLFDRYELVTGAAQAQTVLPGLFLGGDMAALAVLHVEQGARPRLQMYGFADGAWAPVLEAPLAAETRFVDVAEIGGRDRLITYASGRLSWFDPDAAAERKLAEVAVNYRSQHDLEGSSRQPGGEIPRVDVTRDLNHDGREDLVVPDVDGFWIAVQMSDGSFSEAVKLGPPEPFAPSPVGKLEPDEAAAGPRTYGEMGITAATIPVYLSRVHQMDHDQDGRSDLVFWNADHFDVHHQDAHGLFDPQASSVTTEVAFDSEGIYSRAFEYTDASMFSFLFGTGKRTSRTVLHSLRDLNGDQLADLVTLTLTGPSLTRQRSVYEVHFGSSTPDGVAFAPEVGATIRPRGKAAGMQPWGYSSQRFEDFDGDGGVDVMFRDVKVSMGGMARALVGNSVPLNLELYRIADGVYPDRPTMRRKIRDFAPFAGIGNVFFPAVLTGDVNGDGRSDLLVGKSPGELHVYLGEPGPGLLARKPLKVAVALPHDERRARLVDLNRDGKQDLLIHLAPTDRSPDRPNRLTMLVAR